MSEAQAISLAAIIGGEPWQSGGDIWLVLLTREDGAVVVFSGDAVCEYENLVAFENGEASGMIRLA